MPHKVPTLPRGSSSSARDRFSVVTSSFVRRETPARDPPRPVSRRERGPPGTRARENREATSKTRRVTTRRSFPATTFARERGPPGTRKRENREAARSPATAFAPREGSTGHPYAKESRSYGQNQQSCGAAKVRARTSDPTRPPSPRERAPPGTRTRNIREATGKTNKVTAPRRFPRGPPIPIPPSRRERAPPGIRTRKNHEATGKTNKVTAPRRFARDATDRLASRARWGKGLSPAALPSPMVQQ